MIVTHFAHVALPHEKSLYILREFPVIFDDQHLHGVSDELWVRVPAIATRYSLFLVIKPTRPCLYILISSFPLLPAELRENKVIQSAWHFHRSFNIFGCAGRGGG